MDDITSAEIQKRIDALPPEIKNLVYSTEMATIIQQVGTKNQLHVDQIGALESEVAAAMIGITDITELATNISDSLSTDKVKTDAIVKDVNEMLLDKVRSQMKQSDTHATETLTPSSPAALYNPPMERSVVMPSSVDKTPADNPPKPSTPPIATTPVKPAGMPTMPHVDAMLTQPTVSIAPTAPSPDAPQNAAATPAPIKKEEPPTPGASYAATDPYHEPID